MNNVGLKELNRQSLRQWRGRGQYCHGSTHWKDRDRSLEFTGQLASIGEPQIAVRLSQKNQAEWLQRKWRD